MALISATPPTAQPPTRLNGHRASARPPTSAAQRRRQRALIQTLRAVLAYYAESGLSERERRDALLESLQGPPAPPDTDHAAAFRLVRRSVALLAAWHRDAAYVNADGQPRALPLRGRVSLSALIARHLPDDAPATVRDRLIEYGVIDSVAGGRYRPLRRTLILPRASAPAEERVPFVVHGLLSTLTHNANASLARDRRVERTVYVERFPARDVAQFQAYARESAGDLITRLDNYLIQRELPPDSDEPAVSLGLSLFAYAEPAPPARQRAARPTPRSKRRR